MELPERLGKYLLIERIAVGGMAEIYKARTAGLGGFEKVLAVKRLHARYSQDSDFVKMLIDEAKIAVQLSHTNIAQIFDLDRLGDHYFISMEYVDGRDVHRLLRRLGESGKLLPVDLCCYIAKEACAGLDYAHRKMAPDGTPLRIIHRDVSPQNLLISWEGEVKVVDFGVAKAARRAYETESGIIKGKFYYMSPEQALGEPLDHRSDIFSLGVVVYEALTGRLLYTDAADNEQLLNRVREADIAPPSKARREIPRRLDQIVMRALARDPEERYQSAAAFGDSLNRFLQQVYPRTGRAALATFIRRHFENGAVAEVEPATSDRRTIMSRIDYQAEPTSLIYDGAAPPEMGGFDDDPFFAELARDGVDGNAMSSPYPPIGTGRSRDSDIEVLPDSDIEIIDETGPTEIQYESPLDDFGFDAALEPPHDEQVTNVRRGGSDDIIDDLGTLKAGGLGNEQPYADLDNEPTRVYRSHPEDDKAAPQAVLAASPGAEHGPLRGESRVEADARGAAQSEEPTVITSIDSIMPPASLAGARRREGTDPRSQQRGAVAVERGRTSPVLIAALFLIVLAIGAALAFSVQLLMRDDGGTAREVAAPTEIPEPTPIPALASYYVTSHPTGARVLLDGDFVGITPATVPGLQVDHSYALRLEYEGHRPHEQPMRPASGGQHSIAFSLEPLLGAAIVQTTPPNAAVSLNGNFVQNAPVTIPGLDTRSTYVVAGSMPGYLTAHQRLDWPEGSIEPLQVNLVLTPMQPDPAEVAAGSLPVASPAPRETEPAARRSEPARERTAPTATEARRDATVATAAAEEDAPARASRSDRTSRRERDRTSRRDRDRPARSNDRASEETPTESSAATGNGLLSVLANPDAHVFIDGAVVSTQTPLMNYELAPGTHRVKVYFVSLRRFSEERRVRVAAGDNESVRFDGEE